MNDRRRLLGLGLGLGAGTLVGLFMLLLYAVSWFPLAVVSHQASDLLFLPSEGGTTDRIVVVALDDASLERVGRRPWSRAVFADAIDRIAADGARVIGIDVVFSTPNPSDPEGDRRMAESLRKAGNVVLAAGAVFERPTAGSGLEDPDRFDRPMPELEAGARAASS